MKPFALNKRNLLLVVLFFITIFNSFSQCDPIPVVWDGTNWTGGFPDVTKEVIIDAPFNTSAGLPQGSFNACSLTVTVDGSLQISDTGFVSVANDAIINGSTNISNGGYISVNSDITINGTFIVDYEGSVVQVDDAGLVNGNAIVRKQTANMWKYFEYTYWSSPVSGETIGNALAQSDPTRRFRFEAGNFKDSTKEANNDGSQEPGQDDIDDDNNDWQFTPAGTIMQPGIGYASHHEESSFILPPPNVLPYQFVYEFTGPFNNGIISVPVLRNVPVPPETEEFDDYNWNLIGNPYPSAIDIDLFFDENYYDGTTNPDGTITGAVYLWSQNELPSGTNNGNQNQNFSTNDYAIINAIGATGIPEEEGGDAVVPNRYIPSGQGFFVAYTDSIPSSTGNVIFNNSMRVTGNNDQFFRDFEPNDNKFSINFTSEDGIFSQMLIGYKQGATNQLDEMYYDAPRNLSSGASAIVYSLIEDSPRKFAIQGRDINSLNSNDVIPIGIKNTIEGQTEFTISVAQVEGGFLNSTSIILKDNFLNIEHDLSDSGYTFTLDSGEFNSRFEIVYASTLSISETNEGFNELIVNSSDNYLNISTSLKSELSKIKLFDLMGRQLIDQDIDNRSEVRLDANSLTNSVFILDITLSSGVKLTKKVINI